MTATKRLKDCPSFRAGWTLIVNGTPMPQDTEWEVKSSFGAVKTAVVLDKDGLPIYDRPSYAEAPNVNVVAYGRDRLGVVRLAVIRQPRPHADDPEQPGVDGHKPVVTGQLPMGFLDKILGESLADTAKREVGEETGASHVLRVEQPAYPWHNPNPTFVTTWSDLYFVEVDLERIEALKSDRSEPIFSAEYLTVPELLARVRDGKDYQGAVYRMCTANSAWFVFFATHPELWRA